MYERPTHYSTKFWSNTHPLMKQGETIADKYLDHLEANSSAPRGTKGKLNRLGSLMHRHYRFYNDGDAFTYKKQRVGSSSPNYSGRMGRYYYNIEYDNKMLKLMEEEMADLIKELWELTDGATK